MDIRDGKVYRTIQVGNQCWMRDNLNTGDFVSQAMGPANNSIIEKYCYDDNAMTCDTFGGLYDWDEMMAYGTAEGTVGICPNGWRLATDAEWQALFSFAGAPLGADSTLCDGCSLGFDALLGGLLSGISGNFANKDNFGYFWTSTEQDATNAWSFAGFRPSAPQTNNRDFNPKTAGLSVRCIQDTTTHVSDPKADFGLRLEPPIPQPSSQQVRITYALPRSAEAGKLLIYDLQGQLFRAFPLEAGATELQFSVRDFPAGNYLYLLETAAGNSNPQHLIVQH